MMRELNKESASLVASAGKRRSFSPPNGAVEHMVSDARTGQVLSVEAPAPGVGWP